MKMKKERSLCSFFPILFLFSRLWLCACRHVCERVRACVEKGVGACGKGCGRVCKRVRERVQKGAGACVKGCGHVWKRVWVRA